MTAAFKDKSIQNQTFNCFSSSQDGINRDCRYPNTPAIPYLWQLFSPLGSLALFRSSISKHEDHLSSYLTMFENMLANSGDPDRTAPKEQSDLGLHCFDQTLPSNYLG